MNPGSAVLYQGIKHYLIKYAGGLLVLLPPTGPHVFVEPDQVIQVD